eukprot:COSAG06_NODE_110_length_23500_cov_328.629204_13_plen_168_part_00
MARSAAVCALLAVSAGRARGQQPPLPSPCAYDPSYQYIFALVDDPAADDVPNTVAAIASRFGMGAAETNAFYIGNAALNAMPVDDFEICAGDSSNCVMDCHTVSADELGGAINNAAVAGLNSDVKRGIGCFTGREHALSLQRPTEQVHAAVQGVVGRRRDVRLRQGR